MLSRSCPIVLALLLTAAPGRATAQDEWNWHDASLAGGVAGLACVLETGNASMERARVILETIRLLHASRETRDSRISVLRKYFETLEGVRASLDRVRDSGGVTLTQAGGGVRRVAIHALLDALGLRFRPQTDASVEHDHTSGAAERRRLLGCAGVDVDRLVRDLNAGLAVEVRIREDVVPLPLAPRVWQERIFGGRIQERDLIPAVMLDRKASLVYTGLAAMEPPALRLVGSAPRVLEDVYHTRAGGFAVVARSIRLEGERLMVPGGDAAAPLWEALVGEHPASPQRFVERLLARDRGRLACFFDTLSRLDPPRAHYALGLGVRDSRIRRERLARLYATFASVAPHWHIDESPFSRPGVDPALVLMLVRVTSDGRLAPPAARSLWHRVFEADEAVTVHQPQVRLSGDDDAAEVEPAWLAERVALGPATLRRPRLDTLLFAQRVFSSPAHARSPDVVVALRGFTRFPALMLVLERMGLSDPSVYAAAARQAAHVTSVDHTRSHGANLVSLQASFALLDRLRIAGTLEIDAAGRLAHSLAALDLSDSAAGDLALGSWMRDELLPALPTVTGARPAEDRLIHALGGAHADAGPVPLFTWERTTYRLDPIGADLIRLQRARQIQGGPDLDAVLQFGRSVARLATSSDADAAVAALASVRVLGGALPRPRADRARPAWVASSDRLREALEGAEAGLRVPGDGDRRHEAVRGLARVAASLLAETLTSIVYAVHVRDPEEWLSLNPEVALRHDFGESRSDAQARERTAWALPEEASGYGGVWRVRGALLALDVGLARLALRRVYDEPPSPSPMASASRGTFIQTAALLNPRGLADTDRASIARAIEAGRTRVAAARTAGTIGVVAADARLGAWRRRLLPWMLAREPERLRDAFSLRELLVLGGGDVFADTLHSWGASMVAMTGCLCTRVPDSRPWEDFSGRIASGLLGARMIDLNLRVAELLDRLDAPAALAPGVLAAATHDFLNAVRPWHEDDWESFAGQARRLSASQMADYVAALASGGPLVVAAPASPPSATSRR